MAKLDTSVIKKDFPILERRVHDGKRLVYLDSAASSQKPSAVIDAMTHYYENSHANVHRGVYSLADEATQLYEQARVKAARFINADSSREILFTKNVTEALNLIAHSWGRHNLKSGDAIVLTEMEHHANLVPWLMLAAERDIELRYIAVDDNGFLDLSNLDRLLDGAKLVSVTAMSNVLGTLPPVRQIADAAHAAGAICVMDGAQYTPHVGADVQELGCDFFGFTSHKMLGPTGIGVLWGKHELLEEMPPFLGGGEMISDVRLDGFEPNELPWKFEAGTPPIAEAIGLAAAIDYLEALGMENVRQHEIELVDYALASLTGRFGSDITIFGPSDAVSRGGAISFAYKDLHAHDMAQALDQHGVCVRAGHHCAKPLMRRLGVAATARASVYIYNDEADIDALTDAIASAATFFA